MKNSKGLLGLLALAGGAFAYWKYKNLSPEEKERLKQKVSDAGEKISEKFNELEENVTDTIQKARSNNAPS